MLRSCIDCLKYKIPTVECDETIPSSLIKFHIYIVFTICYKHSTIGPDNFLCHVCSESISVVKKKNHAKLSKRRMITLKELPIVIFMKEYYISALQKNCIIYSMYVNFLKIFVVR